MIGSRIKAAAVAVLLVAAPMAVEAAPILYAVEFDGSADGDPGAGSFLYDFDTGAMTDFTWDFGSGRTGGILDSSLPAARAQVLFEIMTGTTGSGIVGRSIPFGPGELIGPFPDTVARFCWGTGNFNCGMAGGPTPTYQFLHGNEAFRGFITVTQATEVTEPATLVLFGAGLAGLCVIRRRLRA